MTQQATAAVFRRPGRPLELCRVPFPVLERGEALVEIDCCTVCGSDHHTLSGTRAAPLPLIPGHEIVGRLVECCGDVRDLNGERLRAGDRVCWALAVSCGHCFFCRQDLPQKCESLFKYGHERVTRSRPLSGGLATHCHLLAGTAMVRIPEELPDRVAAPAGCATATAVAALRDAGDCRGKTVLIHGAGMLGLTAAALAQVQGASAVVVTDVDAERNRQARNFGATHTDEAAIPDLTDGRGADVVIDMSGSPDAVETSVGQLRIGGVLILVGSVFPARPLSLRADVLVRKMISIRGVHNYRPRDLQEAVEFLTAHHRPFPFEMLTGPEVSLEKLNDALDPSNRRRPVRLAVRPQGCLG